MLVLLLGCFAALHCRVPTRFFYQKCTQGISRTHATPSLQYLMVFYLGPGRFRWCFREPFKDPKEPPGGDGSGHQWWSLATESTGEWSYFIHIFIFFSHMCYGCYVKFPFGCTWIHQTNHIPRLLKLALDHGVSAVPTFSPVLSNDHWGIHVIAIQFCR